MLLAKDMAALCQPKGHVLNPTRGVVRPMSRFSRFVWYTSRIKVEMASLTVGTGPYLCPAQSHLRDSGMQSRLDGEVEDPVDPLRVTRRMSTEECQQKTEGHVNRIFRVFPRNSFPDEWYQVFHVPFQSFLCCTLAEHLSLRQGKL